MRALVTGCAGFVGSNLTDALLREGDQVVGIDCLTDNYPPEQKMRNLECARQSDNFKFVQEDLASLDLDSLIEGCDVVFHLAGAPGVRTSWGTGFEPYLRNNVLATQRLLEASRLCPERRLVFASSSSIYGQAERFPTDESVLPRPFSPYGTTKLAAEHLCQLYFGNFGVNAVSLRFFSVFGPRQRPDMAFNRFFAAGAAGKPVTVFGDGRQTRDFTFVGDIVEAMRTAAGVKGAEGNVYNIGGGAQVALVDAIAIIEELVGTSLEVRRIEAQLGDVRDTGANTRRARDELGFVAVTDLRAGLAAQFAAQPPAPKKTPSRDAA